VELTETIMFKMMRRTLISCPLHPIAMMSHCRSTRDNSRRQQGW